MFFSLQILEQKPIDYREEFAPGAIDFGEEIRQSSPLRSTGRATLIEERHGRKGAIRDIRVAGDMDTQVEVACARCLETVKRDINRSFDLLYRPHGIDAGRDEISVVQAEAEVGYYSGEGLLLEDVMREQILLAVPLKVLCREDCKGLCPSCGHNLNQGACRCPAQTPDPRWEALSGLKDKLKD